ncbi:MAG: hypothetical protein DSZ27_07400 [Thiomicrospira sp.]|nr:MAG: hypothetical protein DSZ27_07400 [Thiomicrospira sp.]
MSNPLISKLEVSVRGSLADELMSLAHTIENSLIQSGGTPGEDYTLLDLYKLAQPFALEKFRSEKMGYDRASFRTESPEP